MTDVYLSGDGEDVTDVLYDVKGDREYQEEHILWKSYRLVWSDFGIYTNTIFICAVQALPFLQLCREVTVDIGNFVWYSQRT